MFLYGEALIKQGPEQVYQQGGFFTDPSIFKIFSWKLIAGNPAKALSDPNSVVLTQSLAGKLFGNTNPLGKTLDIDNKPIFKITGVIKDPPSTSHFNFSFLISLSTDKSEDVESWIQNQFYTYLLLSPGSSPQAVEKKIKNLLTVGLSEEEAKTYVPFLQPLPDIHLHSNLFREIAPNSDITTIYIFAFIAGIILLIACMNFVNLTTAKAANRAKEVGVRKATGAVKGNLIKQFISESLFVGLIAGIIAYIMGHFLIRPFGGLMGREIEFNIIQNPGPFILLFGLIVLTCILSSIYPAFILSSFKPVKVLKGNFSFKSNSRLRTGLVIFQFTLSISLVLAVLIIGSQMAYMRQKDLGFNKDQVITIPLQNNEKGAELDYVLNKVKTLPGVVNISASANQPGGTDWGLPYEAIGLQTEPPSMRCLVVDENFLNTYSIKMAAGRGFSTNFTTDTAAYLINETAARQLGWENPIGHELSNQVIGRKPGPIIGVVKDFHYHSLHETIEPLYLFMKKDWFTQLNIRIDERRTAATLASLKNLWAEVEPQFPFKYTFLDEGFQAFYESEQRISKLLFWFTVLAILISCMGLFALSTLVAEQRAREIGIRKVLGASVSGIVTLLSRDFLKPVLIAFVLAAPITWYFMDQWLQDFAYKTTIAWWIFAVAGIIAMLIALLTTSFQAIKAAWANPVKSLRTE